MPLAFPSHQGLIAPVWRRWPSRFDGLACGIGAAVPDIVDGVLGVVRGTLGQWLGHGLLGLILLDIPAGVLLTWGTRAAARGLQNNRYAKKISAAIRRHDPPAPIGKLAISVGLGALSHLLFDFVSHGGFLWLVPFYEPKHVFPEWWYTTWFELPLPGYREPYPIGVHFMVWCALSVIGAVIFFWPNLRRKR